MFKISQYRLEFPCSSCDIEWHLQMISGDEPKPYHHRHCPLTRPISHNNRQQQNGEKINPISRYMPSTSEESLRTASNFPLHHDQKVNPAEETITRQYKSISYIIILFRLDTPSVNIACGSSRTSRIFPFQEVVVESVVK